MIEQYLKTMINTVLAVHVQAFGFVDKFEFDGEFLSIGHDAFITWVKLVDDGDCGFVFTEVWVDDECIRYSAIIDADLHNTSQLALIVEAQLMELGLSPAL